MKTFVKENWYKLMIGSSMFIFSVSALIYSVSPVHAEIPQINNKNNAAASYYDHIIYDVNMNKCYALPAGKRGINASEWVEVGY